MQDSPLPVNTVKKEKFEPLDIDYKVLVQVKGPIKAGNTIPSFTVPVGFGYKTVTWLALCAA